MDIRQATASDRSDILDIHTQAFGSEKGPEIVELVDGMLDDPTAQPMLSLVAVSDGKLMGNILFTPVRISGPDEPISARILAPLAVRPEAHKQGVGQALIQAGLKQLKSDGVELVFVLGHPEYYPRCGFVPAGERGFDAPYPIPPEHAAAWMIQELNGNAIGRVTGQVHCSDVLNQPQHWKE
jgi:putative acetyltransferase